MLQFWFATGTAAPPVAGSASLPGVAALAASGRSVATAGAVLGGSGSLSASGVAVDTILPSFSVFGGPVFTSPIFGP